MSELKFELREGRFKGVPFLVSDVLTVNGGRKTVVHEIPNSDKRTIEDLGLLNKTFTLNVSTAGSNELYFLRRDALITAMEQKEAGLLIHPTLGSLTVNPINYSLTEDMSNIGEALFSLNFQIAQTQFAPFKGGGFEAEVARIASEANQFLGGDVGSLFNRSRRFPNNFTQASNMISGFIETARNNVGSINTDTNEISNFNSQLDEYEFNKFRLIENSAELGETTKKLFDTMNNLGSDDRETFKYMQGFFDFFDESELLPPINSELKERNLNADVYSQAIQGLALSNAYKNVVFFTFKNSQQLENTRVALDEQFIKLTEETVLSDSSLNSLQNLRTAANKFFEEQSVTAFKVSTFAVSQSPISIITFNLYGSTDLTDELIDLNQLRDVSFVDGDIRMLTG